MSGGSYDYAYFKIEQMADDLQLQESSCSNHVDFELRKRFRKHLYEVADACKAIEWNDSGDGNEDEIHLIKRALGETP